MLKQKRVCTYAITTARSTRACVVAGELDKRFCGCEPEGQKGEVEDVHWVAWVENNFLIKLTRKR